MSIVWFYFGQITEIFAFTFAYIFFVKLVKKFSSDQRRDVRKTIPRYFAGSTYIVGYVVTYTNAFGEIYNIL